VAGLLRENGSALHRGERVARTDPLPATWLRQGLQILGRSTTAELGMGYDTSTVYQGLQVTRNPWNTDYTAGARRAVARHWWQRVWCRLRMQPTAPAPSASRRR